MSRAMSAALARIVGGAGGQHADAPGFLQRGLASKTATCLLELGPRAGSGSGRRWALVRRRPEAPMPARKWTTLCTGSVPRWAKATSA